MEGKKKKIRMKYKAGVEKKKSRRRETSCILLFARLLKDIFCGSIARYNIQFGAHHSLASLSCVAWVQRWLKKGCGGWLEGCIQRINTLTFGRFEGNKKITVHNAGTAAAAA